LNYGVRKERFPKYLREPWGEFQKFSLLYQTLTPPS
jgi:hypothetical protein